MKNYYKVSKDNMSELQAAIRPMTADKIFAKALSAGLSIQNNGEVIIYMSPELAPAVPVLEKLSYKSA